METLSEEMTPRPTDRLRMGLAVGREGQAGGVEVLGPEAEKELQP